MELGEKLQQLRKTRGMTQEELGAKLGLKKAAIHKYETGLVDLRSSTLEKLAAALDTTPAYLLGLEDPPLPAGAVPYHPTQRIPILFME